MRAFKHLVGQDKAVELLQQAVKLDRVAPAYLFSGTSGIGRGIAAKSFAYLVLSQGLSADKQALVEQKIAHNSHPDLLWVEPTYLSKGELYTAKQAAEHGLRYKTPPKIRIEQIRRLTQFLQRPLLEAERKIVAIQDAQTMSEAPANALLKTLEEPGQATLILIVPDADLLLSTLVSRCQKIQFYPLSMANLKKILELKGYEEILNHPELIEIAQGSPGKAIAAWHQLQTIPEELLEQLKSAITTPLAAFNLAKAITTELDGQSQLWLVDYLQYYYWHKNQRIELMQQWEATRRYLLSYVQPRLVWECMLLSFVD